MNVTVWLVMAYLFSLLIGSSLLIVAELAEQQGWRLDHQRLCKTAAVYVLWPIAIPIWIWRNVKKDLLP